jgi:hypothetical protein
MKLTETTLKKSKELLIAIDIADKIMSDSIFIDKKTADAFLSVSIWMKNLIAEDTKNGTLKSVGLKSLVDSFLIFWNESVSVDAEIFWIEIEFRKIKFTRKEPLLFVLKNGRFRNVHQGIDARKNWSEIVKSGFLKKRFTDKEIEDISNIIKIDEKIRYDFLAKCLKTKKIPSFSYLKFGDSMAYFRNCDLFIKYFTDNEIKELNEIWISFK